MPEPTEILNEFYDAKESDETLQSFIEKYKDVPEAEPILNTAKQALNNNNSKPVTKKEISNVKYRSAEIPNNTSNPLFQYFRPPGIYVTLPSQGKFYTNKPKLTEQKEILVKAMTAKDELSFKAPDLLMNGESLIDVIKSCVPDIDDPNELPNCDFNVIMLAIRLATYGSELSYSAFCEKCEESNDFGVDVERLLDRIESIPDSYYVQLDQLKVYIKQYTLKSQIKAALARFEQAAITNSILSNDELSQAEKTLEFNKSFNLLARMTYEIVLDSIIKIETPNNEIIDNRAHITEWLYQVGKKQYDAISSKLEEITKDGFDNLVEFNCTKCNEPNKVPIVFDPTSFFG